MNIKIALAGNPNSGKTTLFNALTGSNQFVGNWPGVTVEKKEGKLKGNKEVVVMDLPGIYSLSPYSPEEVVSRNYLIDDSPDVILNIVDGTNLERNLYLTAQLIELGIPTVIAINMMDVVNKNGDKINVKKLSDALGCKMVEISALKGDGITEAANAAIEAAKQGKKIKPHGFSPEIENALTEIEKAFLINMPENQRRWFAVKLFERDKKIFEKLHINEEQQKQIDTLAKVCEDKLDDDSESLVTSQRYSYIDTVIEGAYTVKNKGKLTVSDKIDRVVTNRWLALPIFGVVMFLVYFISVTTVGALVTDWVYDGLCGDGWHLLGIGSVAYEETLEEYEFYQDKIDAYLDAADGDGISTSAIREVLGDAEADDRDGIIVEFTSAAADKNIVAQIEVDGEEFNITLSDFKAALSVEEPDPSEYGVWVPGIPVLLEMLLDAMNCVDWLKSLILDGIVAGVGAVLGFVPQILILFLFLALLEACGYMARIAFIMDRIFRRFGLSGKSFIPILIGTGCGVPGLMASRTIENENDRRMTLMTTTFIPCSAKLPIIGLIAGALFGGTWWVAPSAYFIGIAAIICSGIILKKTPLFRGEASPFIMELPAYRRPTVGNVMRSVWERGWSFIKKAGTIILLATIFIWFMSSFGWGENGFGMVDMQDSMLAAVGSWIAWIFAPLGWGNWEAAVAAITGLIAKENVVGTLGILYRFGEVSEYGNEIWGALAGSFTALSAFSFLVFNLLCAPCFAAMGAIRREMNNTKWLFFAIGYQCVLAYIVAMCIYQWGMLFSAGVFGVGTMFAILFTITFLVALFCPAKYFTKAKEKIEQVFKPKKAKKEV